MTGPEFGLMMFFILIPVPILIHHWANKTWMFKKPIVKKGCNPLLCEDEHNPLDYNDFER